MQAIHHQEIVIGGHYSIRAVVSHRGKCRASRGRRE
jgi:hypothetical protein